MHTLTNNSLGLPALAVLAHLGLTAAAHASLINGGAGVITTFTYSSTTSFITVETPVTLRVDDFATKLSVLLNGIQISSNSFVVPVGDPLVQAAVAAADALLSGDGATFGTPGLFSTSTVLESSVTRKPTPNLSCEQLVSSGYQYTGANTVASTSAIGPATINIAPVKAIGGLTLDVNDCQPQTFFVVAGTVNINTNTDYQFAVPIDVTTTNTFLTTQTYTIAGTTSAAPVPEPASALPLLFACAVLFMARQRHA